MAVVNYHEHHGHYPPAYIADKAGRPMHSWRVLILPYIEQGELFKAYDLKEPWDGPNNRKLAARMPKTYAFHGSHQPGNTTTNYLAVVGPGTVWPGRSKVSEKDVTDGRSSTILIVENQGAGVHWMEPRDLSFADMDFAVNSPKGIRSKYTNPAVVMLDASVQRLSLHLKPDTLRALLTIRGGEKLQPDEARGWERIEDGRDRPLAGP